MEFREATQSDLDYMLEHSISTGCPRERPKQTDFVYTLEHHGDIIMVGGFRLINTTTAWGWLDVSKEINEHKRVAFFTIREWLNDFVKELGIKRLMCAVRTDFQKGIRTVEHLGFHRESIMKNFFDDKDGYLYVRIW